MNNKKIFGNFKIGVIGSGSWGTALANLLAKKGFDIYQWVFEIDVLRDIQLLNENKKFLCGVKLSKNLHFSNNLEEILSDKDVLIISTPSHVLRKVISQMVNFVSSKTVLISTSKGIEDLTYLTMSGVIKSVLSVIDRNKIVVLSGPSFAKEVAMKIPTLVTVATENLRLGKFVQTLFSTEYFRVYTIDDIIGVEIGGSVKNVIAIAAGIIDGLGFGLNTRAALITRGLVEIKRLGIALGAKPKTFSGLSGVGDLILTCTGDLSRNYSVGKEIGQGGKLINVISDSHVVVEGLNTTKSVYNLSRSLGVDMPITEAVYLVLYRNLSPLKALRNLMTRELKQEFSLYNRKI